MIICYLCGKPILEMEERADDHVPPKQFFPTILRNKHNLQLTTLPAHLNCNSSYAQDEEYFKISLGSVAQKTFSGIYLWRDIARTIRREESQGLAFKVRYEFSEQTESGLYFSPGKVGKKFDPERVYRIVWKIIRGLHYHHYDQFIPEESLCRLRLYDPQQTQPANITEVFQLTMQQPEQGKYPGIFAYKIVKSEPPGRFAYGLLFWDAMIFLGMFHAPDCMCKDCKKLPEP